MIKKHEALLRAYDPSTVKQELLAIHDVAGDRTVLDIFSSCCWETGGMLSNLSTSDLERLYRGFRENVNAANIRACGAEE